MTSNAPVRVSSGGLLVVVCGGGLLVTALWGGQVMSSLRTADVFTTIAHLTGLLAGYGVVVMLLLIARVPAIEHGIGADQLARWHAWGGRYVVGLCSAHAAFALLAYAVRSDATLPTATARLLNYRALAVATVALVVMVVVGGFSARRLRARIPHETWRATHSLMYVAAGLAFAHELSGPDIAGSVLAAWVWSMLHTTVAALLVWYRLVVPVRQALHHGLRVKQVRPEGPDVVSVYITGRDLAALRAEPGQFFRWRFLTRHLWRSALPFSLSAPVGDTMRITVKRAGGHTGHVQRLRPGVRVLATGPFGALTARQRTRRGILLLAGGVGITPLRALFETLPGGRGDIVLLYRASTAEQLVLREELETIAAARGAGLHFLLGPSDSAYNPLASRALTELVPDVAERDVYLCGPPGMTDAAMAALARAGVARDRMHTEQFVL